MHWSQVGAVVVSGVSAQTNCTKKEDTKQLGVVCAESAATHKLCLGLFARPWCYTLGLIRYDTWQSLSCSATALCFRI